MRSGDGVTHGLEVAAVVEVVIAHDHPVRHDGCSGNARFLEGGGGGRHGLFAGPGGDGGVDIGGVRAAAFDRR